jgi:hypothetical protein
MAGSLAGRARRVRRLEGFDRGRERPSPSRTEQEARALDAEIRELEEELRALGVDPEAWYHGEDRTDLSLDEQITELEKELGNDDDH